MSIFDNLFENYDYKHISGLSYELKSIYLNNLFKNTDKGILVVTASLFEASKYFQVLSNYTSDALLFPMDDFLTSEALAISPELKTTRLETMDALSCDSKKIVVTNLMGLLRYLPSKSSSKEKYIEIFKNADIKMGKIVESLDDNGYIKDTLVSKTGEYAVRGFILDIFPINEENPVRLEFFGDTVESIREFDIDSQRTIKECKSITIKPASETNSKEDSVSIYNYLDGLCVFEDYEGITASYNMLVEEMMNYSISNNKNPDTKYMFDLREIKFKETKYFETFDTALNKKDSIKYTCKDVDFAFNKENYGKQIMDYLSIYKTVIICMSDRYKANRVIEEIKSKKVVFSSESSIIEGSINVIIKKITSGFIYNNIIVIGENDLYSKRVENQYKTRFKIGTKVRDINKLNIGDYVVHIAHGIGRYQGLKTLVKDGIKKDYLLIEYNGTDKLYIPVEKIELINKFSPKEGMIPKLNKLGSPEWEKAKLKARKRAEDIAEDLLKLYAAREASVGFSFSKDTIDQIEFEKEFEHMATLDQIKVSEEIKEDMERPVPMDRLLCGDVGYGKTEVAFRAMFKAVLSNKQVALLCPTTILSNQHFTNALNRFSEEPVRIEILNRFVPSSKVKKVIQDLKEGKVDILIGTHRILSEDIVFKDLGLLIIDEEQRFGVKHKEKIKTFKNSIDVLTLSATPIPRTLQMSMAGIRNLSLIETPPIDRYPIQTYVLSANNQLIKDAIYKELSRGGQVFILHNNIETLESKRREIYSVAPDAKIVTAHGRMNKTELEDIMIKFINNEYNVLLCTTIIETGIDIPNVNTLIILDADKFGLSQLYQIRGRVGRSNRIAYCYLMYDKGKVLSEIATKRLKAISEFTELGSGFKIAMRDLAIRGAGDILGKEQAGFVDTVGIDLFMMMLSEEIDRMKGIVKEKEEEKEDSNPLLSVSTHISDDYVFDEEIKIEIHKKINSIDSYEKLNIVKEELEDRFGKLSEDILVYMHEEWFEKIAGKLNIKSVKQTKNFIELAISKEEILKMDRKKLFVEVTEISRMFRFSMRGSSMIITLDIVKLDRHFIYYLIELLDKFENCKKWN